MRYSILYFNSTRTTSISSFFMVPDIKRFNTSSLPDFKRLFTRALYRLTCPAKTGPVIFLDLDNKVVGKNASQDLHTEQIVRKLREIEVLIAKGMTTRNAARQIGVTEQTYYQWRKEYGGMKLDQAKEFKALE